MKDKYQCCSIISAIICGLIAHGYMLTNKLCYHDDATSYFTFGGDYQSGRWVLGIWRDIQLRLGIMQYSTPFWNGLLFILFIALASGIFVKLFQVQDCYVAVLIGGAVVVFPTSASILAYMFTAPAYGFAILLAVLCVYISHRVNWGWIPAIIMLTISMGIYQSYFGVATALFILKLIMCQDELKKKWECAWRDLGVLLGGIAGYFICNKICLHFKGVILSDYQGINQMGRMSFQEIAEAVGLAYKQFFLPLYGDYYGITNVLWIRILFAIQMGLTVALLIVSIARKQGLWAKLFQALLVLLIPLSVNIIFVMTGSEGTLVHTLMVVPYVFVLLYPLLLCERMQVMKTVKVANGIVLLLMLIFFAKLDNTAYLKATHDQEVAISYYTNLIGRIKSVEGYSPSMPVLFFGKPTGEDVSIAHLEEYESITLQGYYMPEDAFVAHYANEAFLKIHCGYTYTKPENRVDYLLTEEFAQMPVYPQDGSVREINGVIVVRLAQWE